jgi:hypothetical protein
MTGPTWGERVVRGFPGGPRELALLALLVAAGIAPCARSQAAGSPTVVVLSGVITRADKGAWIDVPFEVPDGTERIDVRFEHEGRGAGTAIEVGLADPQRFRGASRTSKTAFFVGSASASPSYAAGALPAGTWRLILGVPSIPDAGRSGWKATLTFSRAAGPELPPAALEQPGEARWYVGDPHTHTAHSDGFGCAGRDGGRRGCTVFEVAAAAAARGLDFVAVTDHNTTSHHAELPAVQHAFDRLLLLRGQELTTFYGHANVFGTSEVMDFRLGAVDVPGTAAGLWSPAARPTITSVLRRARHLGALVSVNHPGRETGDRCTGCGWSPPATDFSLVDAIEVVNGGTISGPTSGTAFWHARLNEGHRLSAIGGSDDHGASQGSGRVGTPATVIWADGLSERALLEGIRRGRVYVRTRGPEGPAIDCVVERGDGARAHMGDELAVANQGERVDMVLSASRATGHRVEVWRRGELVSGTAPATVSVDGKTMRIPVTVRPGDWVSVSLRDRRDVSVIGNAIYLVAARNAAVRTGHVATRRSGPTGSTTSPSRTTGTAGG